MLIVRIEAPDITPPDDAMIRAMLSAGVAYDRVTDSATATDFLVGCLRDTRRIGSIVFELTVDERLVARLIPTSPHFRVVDGDLPRTDVQLSRFALLRRVNRHFLAERATGFAALEIHDGSVHSLLTHLLEPAPLREKIAACTNLIDDDADYLARMLWSAGLIEIGDAEPSTADLWTFHDYTFHHYSRFGAVTNLEDARHRHEPDSDLFSARYAGADDGIALFRPNLGARSADDMPLTEAVEARRSVREHDDANPIDLQTLGAFLYRTARVRSVGKNAFGQWVTNRPYPASGARYELEIYALANHCAGLHRALYIYNPMKHSLHIVLSDSSQFGYLLAMAATATPARTTPQVLFVIAARMPRLYARYQRTTTYALALKNVGGLFATMGLVATAMGLAGCAIGVGDAIAFAAMTGDDRFSEVSVGEFILGRGKADT